MRDEADGCVDGWRELCRCNILTSWERLVISTPVTAAGFCLKEGRSTKTMDCLSPNRQASMVDGEGSNKVLIVGAGKSNQA